MNNDEEYKRNYDKAENHFKEYEESRLLQDAFKCANSIIDKATEKVNRHIKIYSPHGSLLEEVKVDQVFLCHDVGSIRLFNDGKLVANIPSNYLLLIYKING